MKNTDKLKIALGITIIGTIVYLIYNKSKTFANAEGETTLEEPGIAPPPGPSEGEIMIAIERCKKKCRGKESAPIQFPRDDDYIHCIGECLKKEGIEVEYPH